MTGYHNYIKDFPRRCRDILAIAGKPALSRGREVTLTLMVASAGFIVPYERLKPDNGWGNHPSGDGKRFYDAAAELKLVLDQPFLSSRFWTKTSSTWHVGRLASLTGEPDSWEGLRERKPISREKKVYTVLNVIRNALAHGNIWAQGNPIESIIFVSAVAKVVPVFAFLSVAPREFRDFLENWFDFLTDLDIPPELVFEVLRDAA